MILSRALVKVFSRGLRNSPVACDVSRLNITRRLVNTVAFSESDDSDGRVISKLNYNSTFEDDEGNPLEPTGMLTFARPLRSNKLVSKYLRVSLYSLLSKQSNF